MFETRISLTEKDLIYTTRNGQMIITGIKLPNVDSDVEISFPSFKLPVILGDGQPLTCDKQAKITVIDFPTNCLRIEANAFANFTELVTLNFNCELTEICANNFFNCKKLTIYRHPLVLPDNLPEPDEGLDITFRVTNNPWFAGVYYVVGHDKIYQLDNYGRWVVSTQQPTSSRRKLSVTQLTTPFPVEFSGRITGDFNYRSSLSYQPMMTRSNPTQATINFWANEFKQGKIPFVNQMSQKYSGQICELLDAEYFCLLPEAGKQQINKLKKTTEDELTLICQLMKLTLVNKKYDDNNKCNATNDAKLANVIANKKVVCRHIVKLFNLVCQYAGFAAREILCFMREETDTADESGSGHCFTEIYSPTFHRGLPIDITTFLMIKPAKEFGPGTFGVFYNDILRRYDYFSVMSTLYPTADFKPVDDGFALLQFNHLNAIYFNNWEFYENLDYLNDVAKLITTPVDEKTRLSLYPPGKTPKGTFAAWPEIHCVFGASAEIYRNGGKKAKK